VEKVIVARPRVVNQSCFFPGGGCFQYQSTSAQFEEFSRLVRLIKGEKGVGRSGPRGCDTGRHRRRHPWFDEAVPYRYLQLQPEAQLRGLSRRENMHRSGCLSRVCFCRYRVLLFRFLAAILEHAAMGFTWTV
jgi:hypothetical protein